MTEKLMSEAEMDEYIKKVWGNVREKLDETIEFAIRSELMLRAQTLTKRKMDALLTPLVTEVVERNTERIKSALNARAEKMVEMAVDRFDEKLKYTLQNQLAKSVQDPLHELGNRLSDVMWGIVNDIVTEGPGSSRTARHARRKSAGSVPSKRSHSARSVVTATSSRP
jgi:hypothetical protein